MQNIFFYDPHWSTEILHLCYWVCFGHCCGHVAPQRLLWFLSSQHFVLVCSLSSGMLRMIQRNGEASVAAERFELQDALQGKQGGLITAGISWDALMGGLCEGYV